MNKNEKLIIKSKAKTLSTNQWVYGDIVNGKDGKVFIFYFEEDIETDENPWIKFEVNPDTICHTFGATDIDGSLIYTNDILIGGMGNCAGHSKQPKTKETTFLYKTFLSDHTGEFLINISIIKKPKEVTYTYYPHINECKITSNKFD